MITVTKSIDIKYEKSVGNSWYFHSIIRNEKILEIVRIAGNLSSLKTKSRHRNNIAELWQRARNVESKFKSLTDQFQVDAYNFDKLISYYIRNKYAVIKENREEIRMSGGYSISGLLVGECPALKVKEADFINVTAEFWDCLRYVYADRMGTKSAEDDFSKFMKKHKCIDGSKMTGLHDIWNIRKHSFEIKLSGFHCDDEYNFEEPKISHKKLESTDLSVFIENLLDDTLFLLRSAESLSRDKKFHNQKIFNNEL
ncbi:MAG: hypothetical protein UT66_C0053G0003 [candidate division CPR2 bacterium GW2011_GWC1_39_9]|uniref:Uncharacterized protein n=1 Tax=candidate division CPR2 bacterium GW2011_GWC2_39_10 TaxID=1618345 RepID=A0A0G0PVG7_UNCC2|nr:MAG: hypothetical protein UT18_C0022G0010 [candidate division CPR2 bacterium GW2011_GWC2_39_10]KKR32824.1 MAG: hypothetical protein UT66_C0053G0003 [candidate division CPR2 bacterium GW2011_GWC1_39_9]